MIAYLTVLGNYFLNWLRTRTLRDQLPVQLPYVINKLPRSLRYDLLLTLSEIRGPGSVAWILKDKWNSIPPNIKIKFSKIMDKHGMSIHELIRSLTLSIDDIGSDVTVKHSSNINSLGKSTPNF